MNIRLTLTEQKPADMLFNFVWANAFKALQEFMGWSLDTMNKYLKNYHPLSDNDEYVYDICTYQLQGKNDSITVYFYFNNEHGMLDILTEEELVLEANADLDAIAFQYIPEVILSDEKRTLFSYTCPITQITFKFYNFESVHR